MSIKASIDIGTNSTRLLVADVTDSDIDTIFMQEKITRLGDGISKSGHLSPEAMERVIKTLETFKETAEKHKAAEFKVFTTSAARDAVNRQDFIGLVKERTDLTCDIISGDKEARLSFLGVMSDMATDNRIAVCDIGGGSTEIILAQKNNIQSTTSIDIGSRRLTRLYIKSDPPSSREIRQIKDHASSLINARRVDQVICVGGTATTLGMIDAGLSAETVHHHILTLQNLKKIVHQLASKTIDERKAVPGLNPERADVILAGAIIILQILDKFQVDHTMISTRDLLFGIFLDKAKNV